MRRRAFIAVLGGAATWPIAGSAQQPATRLYKVGIVWAGAPAASAPRFNALREALRELGYVEGVHITFQQYGPGRAELARPLIAELVSQGVDVILTAGTSPTRAAKELGGSTPIVMTFVSDPIGFGFAKSLAHPGGTITGLTNFGPEMSAKWLELLKTLDPKASRVVVLHDAAVRHMVREMERAATTTGTQIAAVEMKDSNELNETLSSVQRMHAQALIVTMPPRAADEQTRILQFAAANRLPTVYWWREYVDAGGLVYYGPSVTEMYRRAATYVDKILKGVKPADLPIEQPARFDLVINLKTAKALSLEIPPTLMAQADEVIE
jgi:ABC-type uncharacterized transport system substrate-binding protein